MADVGLPKAGFFRVVRCAAPVRLSALSLPRADRSWVVKARHVQYPPARGVPERVTTKKNHEESAGGREVEERSSGQYMARSFAPFG